MPFFDPVNDSDVAPATKWARGLQGLSIAAFVVCLFVSMFGTTAVAATLAIVGIAISVIVILVGTARIDGKKRQTIMVGAFMTLLWLLLLAMTLTTNGF